MLVQILNKDYGLSIENSRLKIFNFWSHKWCKIVIKEVPLLFILIFWSRVAPFSLFDLFSWPQAYQILLTYFHKFNFSFITSYRHCKFNFYPMMGVYQYSLRTCACVHHRRMLNILRGRRRTIYLKKSLSAWMNTCDFAKMRE